MKTLSKLKKDISTWETRNVELMLVLISSSAVKQATREIQFQDGGSTRCFLVFKTYLSCPHFILIHDNDNGAILVDPET
jgi:hypothetical protein